MANKYVELINTNTQVQIRLIAIIALSTAIAILGPLFLNQQKEMTRLENKRKQLLANNQKNTTTNQDHQNSKLALEGIMNINNELVALINGKICTPGDTVENYLVKEISAGSVTLEDSNTKEVKTLSLPTGINL